MADMRLIDLDFYAKQEPRFRRFLESRFSGVETTGQEAVRALGRNARIEYIIPHTSHVDWIAGGLALYAMGMSPPSFIASTDLEEKLFVGNYLRNMGAFFVDTNNFVMNYWIKKADELVPWMKNGRSVFLFPEGTRSRTGGFGKPNPLFVKVPVDASEEVETYVVPMAVAGDCYLEGKWFSRNAPKDDKEEKKRESGLNFFWNMFGSCWLNTNGGGKVYADFGEPINVREFIKDLKGGSAKKARGLCEYSFGKAVERFRVTPTALTAWALGESRRANPGTLAEYIERDLGDVEGRGVKANFDSIKGKTSYAIMGGGIEMLERMGAVGVRCGEVFVLDGRLVQYYANRARHLFVLGTEKKEAKGNNGRK